MRFVSNWYPMYFFSAVWLGTNQHHLEMSLVYLNWLSVIGGAQWIGINWLFMNILSLMIIFSRTRQVATNLTHRVDPRGEEIQAPLTLDRVLDLGVVLDQTHQQRTTVTKRHQTMNPVTKSKAESLQPSKWTVALQWLLGDTWLLYSPKCFSF